jgi:WD40 repeat protein
VRLCMDPGGVLAICCHSDGCVRMYDIQTGQLLYRAWGHAAQVAAATLSPDLTSLVSVGGDGCIVVWQLPGSLIEQLQAATAAVAEAQEQAGCQMPSPQLLGRQCVGFPAPPSPAGTAAIGGTATPSSQQGDGGPGSRATPGSCVSEGGMSSTMRRIQQGKPLVSADKLPRWARSPSVASTAAAHASDGGVAAGRITRQQQPQPQRVSKWLAGRQPCDPVGQGAATLSDPGAQVRRSLAASKDLSTVTI